MKGGRGSTGKVEEELGGGRRVRGTVYGSVSVHVSVCVSTSL